MKPFVFAACLATLMAAPLAAAQESSRVYTYSLSFDADGRITALAPATALDAAIDQWLRRQVDEMRLVSDTRHGAVTSHLRLLVETDANGTPVRVLSANAGAMPTRLELPTYPADALRNGQEGVVVLRLGLDAEGRVADARVERNQGDVSRSMASAALAAARDWRFQPESTGRQAQTSEMLVPVCFYSQGSAAEACRWSVPGHASMDGQVLLSLDPLVRVESVALASQP